MRLMFILLTVVCCGCGGHHIRDTTLYTRTGQPKPIVAVLPVINNSQGNLIPWDLSREFTEEIRKRVYDSPKIYLLRENRGLEMAAQLNVVNPNDIPTNVTEKMGAAEFVLVSELIEQEEKPSNAHPSLRPSIDERATLLSFAMRVRVIDLRKQKPEVILQEVITCDQDIAIPYMNCDYAKAPWGSEAFERSPMGMAHNKLVKELVGHVESYISTYR